MSLINAHVDIYREATGQTFGLILHLRPNFKNASSECCGEPAHICAGSLEHSLLKVYTRHARIQKVFSEGVQLCFLVNEWIQITLKSGHHRPASVSLACRWWPSIEWWIGSFVFFRGPGPVLL